MNKVTMVVTDKQVGYSFLRSCKNEDDKSLYLVPTYLMKLEWTKNGKKYTCEYEVVRFGINYDPAKGRTFVDGIKYLPETKILTWFDYRAANKYAEPGGWKIRGHYMVHDGPGNDSIDGETENDTFSYAFAA